MQIACLSISHKIANIGEIEKAWIGVDKLVEVLKPLKESAFIFTCNRFEVYVFDDDAEKFLKDFASNFKKFEIFVGDDCLRHILRLASGLESMVVGEDQILGQIRHYFNLCKQLGLCKEFLSRVFSKAINTGIRVRMETKISRGAVSVGSAAVELAERVLNGLKGKKVLIIGAGEMGSSVAKAIKDKGTETIIIANRTFSRAQELAKIVNGIAVRFDKFEEYLAYVDVVFSATAAPHVVLTRDAVEKAIKKKNFNSEKKENLIIIDISLPRNVEESVSQIPNVFLFTIDDLRIISEENLKSRIEEAKKAEKIVEEELEHLKLLLEDLKARRAIASMYLLAEKFIEEEVEEIMPKLARYNFHDRELIYCFARSLIKKFLALPTERLKEAARNGKSTYIDSICYLFGGENVSESKDEEVKKRKFEEICE
ncbi:MAG: glutamyl-tRNA reductase [Archaeoglobaceae archaeon]|nr:glutamyl-tRNA reductase [Archaeoglobaceae archaeon]MCX8152608.1 glutamyl-tRNA reductase [Archaeoglobaceae archaeon]MDW8014110.1 glutamyl-tRNA reductase [Archaeoglobaceae archaeon]